MRRLVILAVVALAGCRADPDPDLPPAEWSGDVQTVADGSNRFAVDLYRELAKEDGNVFFSPCSVHAALAMTATGARGETRDQMARVLHLPADPAEHLAAGDLGRYYARPRPDAELAVANALWGQKGFPWRAEWLVSVNRRFAAGLHEADFSADPEAERNRINRWVEEQTRERIKELLLPEDVTRKTAMVLANAIYFKAAWATEFPKRATRDATFRLAAGGSLTATMMNRRGQYRYAETDTLQLLVVPYKDEELAMVVVLPREPAGLPAVERGLTADALAGWLGQSANVEVDVTLPRFRAEQRFELPKPLKGLGMTAPFEPEQADFTGMADYRRDEWQVWISNVLHKAYVAVDEEGTEAAAATAVVMSARPVSLERPRPIKVFRADRPFLFLIRDMTRGTILFMGRVANPHG